MPRNSILRDSPLPNSTYEQDIALDHLMWFSDLFSSNVDNQVSFVIKQNYLLTTFAGSYCWRICYLSIFAMHFYPTVSYSVYCCQVCGLPVSYPHLIPWPLSLFPHFPSFNCPLSPYWSSALNGNLRSTWIAHCLVLGQIPSNKYSNWCSALFSSLALWQDEWLFYRTK